MVSQRRGKCYVTGASSGLGKVYADRIAQRGYDLTLVARRQDRLETLAETLRAKYRVNVAPVVADLGKVADLERVESSLVRDPQVTMLINCAGTATLAPISQTPKDKLQDMIDINITALSRLTMAALVGFKERNHGTIVNIASVSALNGRADSSIYSGTKGYVLNFTRGLQEELGNIKIILQVVLPSATDTEIWEVSGVPISTLDPARIMSAEDCVDAALAGLDRGERITVPSLEDTRLWAEYESARQKLLAATQTGKPASRYRRVFESGSQFG